MFEELARIYIKLLSLMSYFSIITWFLKSASASKINAPRNYTLIKNKPLKLSNIFIESEPALVSISELASQPSGMVLADDLAYFTGALTGLHIFNISHPTNPVLMSSYSPESEPLHGGVIGFFSGLIKSGNLCYISYHGLLIVNVTDPEQPTKVSFYELNTEAGRLVKEGNKVYLLSRWLNIFDVTNPESPLLIIREYYADNSARYNDIALYNNIAYITDSFAGLMTFNVTNSSSPSHLNTLQISRGAQRLQLEYPYLYIPESDTKLFILNVTKSDFPVLISQFSLPPTDSEHPTIFMGYGNGLMRVHNQTAYYTAELGRGILAVDVSNPLSPTTAWKYKPKSRANCLQIAFKNNLLYVMSDTGFQILDSTKITDTIIFTISDSTVGVLATDEYPYVTKTSDLNMGRWNITGSLDDINNLLVNLTFFSSKRNSYEEFTLSLRLESINTIVQTNIRVHNLPLIVKQISNQVVRIGEKFSISFSDSFVAPEDTPLTLNVTLADGSSLPSVFHYNITSQILEGTFTESSRYNVLIAAHDSLNATQSYHFSIETFPLLEAPKGFSYIADKPSILKGISIMAPPYWITQSNCGNFERITVANNIAYLTNIDSGITVVDIANPSKPLPLKRYLPPYGHANDIQIAGDIAYVATDKLLILNVSFPEDPRLIGTFTTHSTAQKLVLLNNTLYVLDRQGLQILDISSNEHPLSLGQFDSPSSILPSHMYGYPRRGVVVRENMAFIADNKEGLKIVNVTDPRSATLIGVYDTSLAFSGTPLYYDVCAAKDLVYVVGFTGYNDNTIIMQIIDVANPTSPQLINDLRIYIGQGMWPNLIPLSIQVVANVAYITCDATNHIFLIDVTTPTDPFIIKHFSTEDVVRGIFVKDNVAYFAGKKGLTTLAPAIPPADTFTLRLENPAAGTFQIPSEGDVHPAFQNETGTWQASGQIPSINDLLANLTFVSAANNHINTNVTFYLQSQNATRITLPLGQASTMPQPIPDLKVPTGKPFRLSIKNPFINFSDNALIFRAMQANGAALPAGMVFDPITLELSSNVSLTNRTMLILTATNSFSTVSSNSFMLTTSPQFNTTIFYRYRRNKPIYLDRTSIVTLPSYVNAFVVTVTLSSHNLNQIVIRGNLAYLVGQGPWLEIVDVSNLATPKSIATYTDTDSRGYSSDNVSKLILVGDLAYLSDASLGFIIMDVSDPQKPSLVANLTQVRYIQGTALHDDILFTTCNSDGLKIFNISNTRSPELISTHEFITNPRSYSLDLVVKNDLAYILNNALGSYISILNITNPRSLTTIATHETERCMAAPILKILDNIAYFQCIHTGLHIIDVSNSNAPMKIGFCPIAWGSRLKEVANGYAYFSRDDEIQIIDVSNPRAPYLTRSIKMPFTLGYGIVTKGNVGFVFNYGEMKIVHPLIPEFDRVTLKLADPTISSCTTQTLGNITSTYNPNNGVWQAEGSIYSLNHLLSNLTIMPAPDLSRNFSATLHLSDNSTDEVELKFHLNQPPVIRNPIPDQTFRADVPFSFTVDKDTFYDPEGDALRFSASAENSQSLPGGLNFIQSAQTFQGTLSVPGSYRLSVKAEDTLGDQADTSFNLHITGTTASPPTTTPAANTLPTTTTSQVSPVTSYTPELSTTPPVSDAESIPMAVKIVGVGGAAAGLLTLIGLFGYRCYKSYASSSDSPADPSRDNEMENLADDRPNVTQNEHIDQSDLTEQGEATDEPLLNNDDLTPVEDPKVII